MHEEYAVRDQVSYMSVGENSVYDVPQSNFEMLSIELEQFWVEFLGVKNAGNRPVSFVESFPIVIWLAQPLDDSLSDDNKVKEKLKEVSGDSIETRNVNEAHMSVIVNIGAKICAQLNHYQYCFLMRLADSFSEMADTVAKEAKMHKDLFHSKDRPSILPAIESTSGNF